MKKIFFGVLLFIGFNLVGQVPDSIEIYDQNAESISYVIPLMEEAIKDTILKVTVVPTKQISIEILEENVRVYGDEVWYILQEKDRKRFLDRVER